MCCLNFNQYAVLPPLTRQALFGISKVLMTFV